MDDVDGVIKMYVASLYWSIMTITTIGTPPSIHMGRRSTLIPSVLEHSFRALGFQRWQQIIATPQAASG